MVLNVEGIDCPDCALKIENKLSGLPELKDVHIDFVSKKIYLKSREGHSSDELLEKASLLIRQEEPRASISAGDSPVKQAGKQKAINPLIIRIIISAFLFVGSFFFHGIPLLSFLASLTAFILAGYDIVWKAISGIFKGSFLNEFFLMSLASIAAAAIGEIQEAVGVMLFYQIGEYLQARAVNRSRRSIEALVNLRPDTVRIFRSGSWVQVSPESVSTGDIIKIRPGERLALDGEVIKGQGMVDSSSLTGESIPVEVATGDKLMSGIIAMDSTLEIEVTRPYEEGALARILKITQEATRLKAPTERFISRFARIYTPFVVGAAVLTAIVPPLVMGWEHFDTWFYRALIFLVVSCPCALVVSIPLSYSAGLGAAARKGILIKGSSFIDRLATLKTIVFDKTGTLTKGNLEINQVRDITSMGEEKLLALAAQAEQESNHPLAKILVSHIDHGSLIEEHGVMREIQGKGVLWTGQNYSLTCGKEDFLREQGFTPETCPDTAIHIARDNQYLGWVSFKDQLRPEAEGFRRRAKDHGINHLSMLSGDNPGAVESVAKKVGIADYQGNLLPLDKLENLKEKIHSGTYGRVAFVGDGINDAPVLAAADIGISMGLGGSDSAVESSDVVLMEDNLQGILDAKSIAQKTKRILWQNIGFAFFAKLFFLTTGALGFIGMWEALFADVGVALIAVLNSLRIMKR